MPQGGALPPSQLRGSEPGRWHESRTYEWLVETARLETSGWEEEELTSGTAVGEYRIDRKIDEGAMGIVYAATHAFLGKRAAIKVIRDQLSTRPLLVQRFILEARAASQLCHPNIVDVFSFGTLSDGRPYFVMELLRGESLASRLRRGALPLSCAIEIIEQVGRALKATHAHGVIHRDLKPDNIFLVGAPDDPVVVKLLDFGVAKLAPEKLALCGATDEGTVIGTPYYMAPEQAQGLAIDSRIDIYSLGVVAFELLTGVVPFDAGCVIELLHMQITNPPPRPRSLRPDIPPALDRLLVEMLAKEPAARPSLEQILAILSGLPLQLSLGTAACAPNSASTTDPMGRPAVVPSPRGDTSRPAVPAIRRRRTRTVGALAAVVGIAFAAALLGDWQERQPAALEPTVETTWQPRSTDPVLTIARAPAEPVSDTAALAVSKPAPVATRETRRAAPTSRRHARHASRPRTIDDEDVLDPFGSQ